MNLRKTFNFGKVDYYGRGRRINRVDVDVELYDKGDGRIVFSVCGAIWNGRGTDCACCGQCLDEIAKFIDDPAFRKIYGYWKLYHLNDMNAASPAQEKLIEEWKNAGNKYDYDAVCKMLEKNNMLEDPTYLIDGKPYRYGSKWLYRPIPKKDLNEIKKILLV